MHSLRVSDNVLGLGHNVVAAASDCQGIDIVYTIIYQE